MLDANIVVHYHTLFLLTSQTNDVISGIQYCTAWLCRICMKLNHVCVQFCGFPRTSLSFHPCSKRCLSSSSNLYIHCLYYELSHKTSPTASEPAAARAAIHFIGANHARRWVSFLDSRGALQALRRLSNHSRQLMCEISEIHTAV